MVLRLIDDSARLPTLYNSDSRALALFADGLQYYIGDPNRADDPQYIVRVVGRMVTVSVERTRPVQALTAGVALPEPAAVEVAAQ